MKSSSWICLSILIAMSANELAAVEPLHLMSFNLRYANNGDKESRNWTNRRDAAAAIIKGHQAEVAGLQEALRGMLDDLATRLPQYAEIGVGRDDGKSAGEYSAILYRKDLLDVTASGTFWFSDTPDQPGSKSWGNNIPRICTWASFRRKSDGLSFDFFNAHFDHQSQPSREKSTTALLERIKSRKHPVFITGDLNAGEDNPAVTAFKSAGFIDTWRAFHPDVPAADSSTFHNFTGSAKGSKIDYIFAPQGWKIINAAIIRTPSADGWPSDHFPIHAVIESKP
jgi:endonuclease/exonuclease/phosphatase family metal-dependent hydrolase